MVSRLSKTLSIAVVVGILAVGIVCAVFLARRNPEPATASASPSPAPASGQPSAFAVLDSYRPLEVPAEGYVSSRACAECHPDQHGSWHASYHRTMTQLALPDAVIGDFNNSQVTAFGRNYRLYREAGICWTEMDNPQAPPGSVPRVKEPMVMTTGSHHMQVYWYPTGELRRLAQLPVVYLKEIQRWIPRNAAFLLVPTHVVSSEAGRWNDTCCLCHTTGPRPRPNGIGGWDTAVTQFGIACEACHGPGAQHIEFRRGAAAQTVSAGQDPIANPGRLMHRRSAEVCGQCHSVNRLKNFATAFVEGDTYRPGGVLEESRVISQDDLATRDFYRHSVPDIEVFMRTVFWADGMVRVSGREYNGLINSACFQQGEMDCVSCHTMHKAQDDPRSLTEWANDQLSPARLGNDACLQCHKPSDYGEAHTHHATASSGSQCYNCHMPHTTYGLLKAIRSHQISSPNLTRDLKARRPNACNLCHLDKTLAWTSDHLQKWYAAQPVELNEDQRTIAASLLWLLRGDAGERALAAWSMGWSTALEASGSQWPAPFLARLLEDPYDAVRYIAHRSLRAQPGFQEFEFDFVGPGTELQAAREKAIRIWSEAAAAQPRHGTELLIDAPASLQHDRVQRLLDLRDNRPVNLSE
jgi:hypothetical protein